MLPRGLSSPMGSIEQAAVDPRGPDGTLKIIYSAEELLNGLRVLNHELTWYCGTV